jgi:hypothetical protein
VGSAASHNYRSPRRVTGIALLLRLFLNSSQVTALWYSLLVSCQNFIIAVSEYQEETKEQLFVITILCRSHPSSWHWGWWRAAAPLVWETSTCSHHQTGEEEKEVSLIWTTNICWREMFLQSGKGGGLSVGCCTSSCSVEQTASGKMTHSSRVQPNWQKEYLRICRFVRTSQETHYVSTLLTKGVLKDL